MQNKELIIQLIEQDMKHQQLVEAICRAGFETDAHQLEIYRIVAQLMGMDVDTLPARWVELYWNCVGVAAGLPVGVDRAVLKGLAEECWMLLCI